MKPTQENPPPEFTEVLKALKELARFYQQSGDVCFVGFYLHKKEQTCSYSKFYNTDYEPKHFGDAILSWTAQLNGMQPITGVNEKE